MGVTDTHTDTGGRDLLKNNNQKLNMLRNDLLMPMLMPAPNLTTTDTTAIPTDGAVTTEDITVTDTPDTTGDKSLSLCCYPYLTTTPSFRRHHIQLNWTTKLLCYINWDFSAKFFILFHLHPDCLQEKIYPKSNL